MKISATNKFLILPMFWLMATCVQAQTAFQNFGFESANLAPIPSGQGGGSVSTLNAIPNWTAYLGGNQVTQMLQNNYTLGNASVDILSPNWPSGSAGGIIEGHYTVVLQPGANPVNEGNNVSASIMQTGLVPASAQSLQFKAEIFSPFSVSLGGQNLSLLVLGTGANYTLYGAEIPAGLIGQDETLAVTALAAPNTTDYFDSFVFSPSSVPEPSTWALMLCGAGAIGLMRRKNKA